MISAFLDVIIVILRFRTKNIVTESRRDIYVAGMVLSNETQNKPLYNFTQESKTMEGLTLGNRIRIGQNMPVRFEKVKQFRPQLPEEKHSSLSNNLSHRFKATHRTMQGKAVPKTNSVR